MKKNVSLYVRQSGTRKYIQTTPTGQYPMGTIFVLRYLRVGKRCWETLTGFQNYQTAAATAMRREIDLFTGEYTPPAPKPIPTPKPINSGLMMDAAIDRYVSNVAIRNRRTARGYRFTLQQFYKATGNKPLSEINNQNLYDFIAYLRKQGLSDRTVSNRIAEVVTFLRHFNIKDVSVRVRYVAKEVRAYRPDELKSLFAAATPEEWLLFQFYLCTGCREQEVANAHWNEVDYVDRLFRVTAKPNWTPKDFEEREIPVPDYLLAALKEKMLTTQGDLIFPTADGKRDGHMLRKLKDLARRAGLVGEFKLHKFRKTYATLQHRAGVDARTIQKRLGHSSLETTLAYLEGEEPRSDRSRAQVNGTFGAFAKPELSIN